MRLRLVQLRAPRARAPLNVARWERLAGEGVGSTLAGGTVEKLVRPVALFDVVLVGRRSGTTTTSNSTPRSSRCSTQSSSHDDNVTERRRTEPLFNEIVVGQPARGSPTPSPAGRFPKPPATGNDRAGGHAATVGRSAAGADPPVPAVIRHRTKPDYWPPLQPDRPPSGRFSPDPAGTRPGGFRRP